MALLQKLSWLLTSDYPCPSACGLHYSQDASFITVFKSQHLESPKIYTLNGKKVRNPGNFVSADFEVLESSAAIIYQW